MKSVFRHLITLILSLMLISGAVAQSSGVSRASLCQNVLDWIYKDLTMKNLDKSIERTKKKLLSALMSSLKNKTTGELKHQPELSQLWLSMSKLDPEFEQYLKRNNPYKKFIDYGFFDWLWGEPDPSDIERINFFKMVKEWKDLQVQKPELFLGMPQELKLDNWDLATSRIVDEIGSYNYENTSILNNIKSLSRNMKSLNPNRVKKIDGKNLSLSQIKNQVDGIQKDIKRSIMDIYNSNFDEYKDFCGKRDIINILNRNSTNYCPAPLIDATPFPTLNQELSHIAAVVKEKNLNQIVKPEKPILEVNEPEEVVESIDRLCPVKIDYFKVKKPSSKATYNMRGENLVDTIVIHHTGTGSRLNTNAEAIHKAHVNRSTGNSHWYMIGYNYLISMGGNGSSLSKPAIIEGRSPAFRGAHAGGDTLPLSPENLNELYDTYQYYNCKEDLRNKPSTPNQVTTKNICESGAQNVESEGYACADLSTNIADINKDGSLSGNVTSIGIAVMGNFDTGHSETFMGQEIYSASKVHISKVKHVLVPKLVSMIKALKHDYPNLKKVVPHNYFKQTLCPGSVVEILSEVARQTGLQVYLSKEEDYQKNRNTTFKHLRKITSNGRTSYVYKSQYRSFAEVSQKIKKEEKLILDIKTDIFLNNRPNNYKQSTIKSAQERLEPLYTLKDRLAQDLGL